MNSGARLVPPSSCALRNECDDKSNIDFSMTLYSMSSIDKASRSVKINFVMDFKYDVEGYLEYMLPQNKKLEASDFRIPWTIPNMIECERIVETHFFKKKCDDCSVYGQIEKIEKRTPLNRV